MFRVALQRASVNPIDLRFVRQAAVSTPRYFSSRDDVNNACRLIEESPVKFVEKYVADDVLWTVTEPTGKSTPISGE
jgi:hypothetical protein